MSTKIGDYADRSKLTICEKCDLAEGDFLSSPFSWQNLRSLAQGRPTLIGWLANMEVPMHNRRNQAKEIIGLGLPIYGGHDRLKAVFCPAMPASPPVKSSQGFLAPALSGRG
jgi:hypothetical protein